MIEGLLRREEFCTTHQGAAFNSSGHLIDGHHRLTAIVNTGVSVWLLMVRAVPDETIEAMDRGAIRSMADVLREDKRVTETLTLAATMAFSTNRPSPMQVRRTGDCGLRGELAALLEHCGTARKFFTSAPMRFAACLTMQTQPSAHAFVLEQYRALTLYDIDAMSTCSRALAKQVADGSVRSVDTRDTFARAIKVFDPARANLTKIQIRADDANATWDAKRAVLGRLMGGLA
jgi:hypothetical protein